MANGTLHHEIQGNRDIEVWRLPDGTVHRTDGPAHRRLLNGTLETAIWSQHGAYHRDGGGPTAEVPGHFYDWHKPGASDVIRIDYWLSGELRDPLYPANPNSFKHRADGPAVIGYFRTGGIAFERWYFDGKLHRDDGPAETDWNTDGKVTASAWHHHGERASPPDGPPYQDFHDDGSKRRQLWFSKGKLDRLDAPAYLEWFTDGTIKNIEYWVAGTLSRTNGPAAIEYYPDGSPQCEQWRVGNRLHRDDGPALTFYHPDRVVAETQWWTHDNRRSDGRPAIEQFDDAGTLTESFHWTMPDARTVPFDRSYTGGYTFNSHQTEIELGLALRLWHRWLLGLEAAPDDAPFTDSEWIMTASREEVRNRLAYLPAADLITNRMIEWRAWSRTSPSRAEIERIGLAFVEYLRTSDGADAFVHNLLAEALAGPLTVSKDPPKKHDGDYHGWELHDLPDALGVPRLLHESIYNASGNYFLPIYWILEPLHGVDVTAWRDLEQAELDIVAGPTGITVGPRF